MITIFIPTYKRPQTLKKAIQSAIDQTWKDLQIVVCDNASGDETQEIIRTFAEKDPRIHSICHPENIGMLGNYTYMLSILNTDFFSFLSDDDILLPHFCETAMEGFSQFPDSAFFAASTVIINEEKKIVRVPLEEWSREGRFLPEEGLREMIGKYVVPTTVLCRKFVEIDPENPSGWDCDFFIQLAARYPFAISKKICGVYLSHSTSFTVRQSPLTSIQSINRLITRVQAFSWMDPKIKRNVTELLHNDLYGLSLRLILRALLEKEFAQAKTIAFLILKNYPMRWKTLLFFIATMTCYCFPPLTSILSLLKKIKASLRRKDFAKQNLESYSQWIFE